MMKVEVGRGARLGMLCSLRSARVGTRQYLECDNGRLSTSSDSKNWSKSRIESDVDVRASRDGGAGHGDE